MSSDQPPTELRRSSVWEWLVILAVSLLIVWAIFSSTPLQSANDRSRWCTVWSLVERGTYQIDEIDAVPQWSTIDKVRHRESDTDPWHFYSSKPPMLSTLVAGLYWLQKATFGFDLVRQTETTTRWLLLFVNGLPMMFALIVFQRSLLMLTESVRTRVFLLACLGVGSMLTPYLTTLNNHTPAAVSLIFCLATMVAVSRRDSFEGSMAGFPAFCIGLTAALTCCFELPAALFGIFSFLFVVRHTVLRTGPADWKGLLTYLVGAAIPLGFFFVTNWICTGGLKPFYAYYGTEKYVYVHEGIPSYWSNPQGLDANTESTATYFFHCVLGHHGLLSMTPIYLLTLIGWCMGLRQNRNTFPVVGSVITVVVLAFYLSRTQNYNYGGNSAALRWMLWIIPFWIYGMLPAVEKLLHRSWGIATAMILLGASGYSSMYSLHDPWKPGWVYQKMEQAGWIDYRTRIPDFQPPRYSVISTVPAEADVSVVWTEDFTGRRLVLTTEAARTQDGETLLPVRMSLDQQSSSDSSSTQQTLETRLLIRREVFLRGADVAEWLRLEADDGSLAVASETLIRFFRGLPAARTYASASPRYLSYTRTNGEKSAVRCDRGAARVLFVERTAGRCWQRCDVMYCDELPFGVARWGISITREDSGEVLHQERWTCRTLP